MSKFNTVIFIIILSIFSPLASAVPTDYLVLSWTEQGGLVSEYHQIVDLPAQTEPVTSPSNFPKVQLLGSDGELVGEVSLKNSLYTRAEYHGHEHIDGQIFQNEKVTFVIKSQQGLVKQLLLPEKLNKQLAPIELSTLIATAKKTGPQTFQKSLPGATDNRINILFMGDGYKSSEQSDFNNDVDNAINYFENFQPYKTYKNFLSYDRLFTASSQSGADKPAACFASPSFVNTKFDATYCTDNETERLLSINEAKVFLTAAASPGFDIIIMVVNDNIYGGSGGNIPTFSATNLSYEILVHEYGHSFTGLADEYTTAFPGYPACDDVFAHNCEPNVTNHTSMSRIKWRSRIDDSTPVPTPDTFQYNNVVGLFEGARYLDSGMYRSERNCNMRTLGASFCDVCTAAYISKVFYGLHAEGGTSQLSLIDPDSPYPTNSLFNGLVSVTQTFLIDIVPPSHGLEVTWFVNNVSQGTYTSYEANQSFDFTPDTTGYIPIKVRVTDTQSFPSNPMVIERVWYMNVSPYRIFTNGFE